MKGTGGWNLHVTLRPRVTKDAIFNVIIQGGAQQEMSGNTGTVVFDFTAPEEGRATYSAQFCYRPGSHSFCNAWAVVLRSLIPVLILMSGATLSRTTTNASC